MCRRCTCDMATGTAWDAFPIWEQKWPATLVIPVFIAGMPAKLTRVQLCRHAGGIKRRRVFSFVREVAQTVPVATSQIHRQHMTIRLNYVFSFPVNQFEIYFPGLLLQKTDYI